MGCSNAFAAKQYEDHFEGHCEGHNGACEGWLGPVTASPS